MCLLDYSAMMEYIFYFSVWRMQNKERAPIVVQGLFLFIVACNTLPHWKFWEESKFSFEKGQISFGVVCISKAMKLYNCNQGTSICSQKVDQNMKPGGSSAG